MTDTWSASAKHGGTVPSILPVKPVKWTVADAPDCVVECSEFGDEPGFVIDLHDPVYATSGLLSSMEPFDMESKAQLASVAWV